MYNLVPKPGFVIVVPLKTSETKEYTGKQLADVETQGVDVLQYGRVLGVYNEHVEFIKPGDVILYPRLASDKTNIGEPRQVIVEAEHIRAKLEKVKDAN